MHVRLIAEITHEAPLDGPTPGDNRWEWNTTTDRDLGSVFRRIAGSMKVLVSRL